MCSTSNQELNTFTLTTPVPITSLDDVIEATINKKKEMLIPHCDIPEIWQQYKNMQRKKQPMTAQLKLERVTKSSADNE
uniref:Uncharacterized protein n=1 Tax=Loa loa TaxID=7209 RepID=A0A1I7W234_LOALO